MELINSDKCKDTRECFARDENGRCKALTYTYVKDGECRFCKPVGNMTNGVLYPERRSMP